MAKKILQINENVIQTVHKIVLRHYEKVSAYVILLNDYAIVEGNEQVVERGIIRNSVHDVEDHFIMLVFVF